ncbi:MAG: Mov34/MPN/PAD-1 family protein [Bacteroidota bacterium]
MNEPEFRQIALSEYWADSQIKRIWLAQSVIDNIQHWTLQSLAEDPIPEVGGFVLGRYEELTPQHFHVSLEVFVPAKEVAYNSPIELDFGPKAMMAIDQYRERYPNLELIAWFHTHPGHTPYLSTMDLNIHEGFFTAPFHLAIVLDSRTVGFDTGFFSRKRDGQVNNKSLESRWISWKSLSS